MQGNNSPTGKTPADPQANKAPASYLVNRTVLTLLAQTGCLTVLIAIGSGVAGYWLDSQLGSRPWLTVGCVLASVPLTAAAIIVRVRTAGAKLTDKNQSHS